MYFCFFSKSLSPLLLPNTVLRPKLLHVNDFAVLKGQDGERRRHLGVEHVPLHGAVLPLAKVLKIRLVERRSVVPPVLMARQDTPELVQRGRRPPYNVPYCLLVVFGEAERPVRDPKAAAKGLVDHKNYRLHRAPYVTDNLLLKPFQSAFRKVEQLGHARDSAASNR